MDGLLGGTAMGSVRGENNHSRVFGGWGICFKKRLPIATFVVLDC